MAIFSPEPGVTGGPDNNPPPSHAKPKPALRKLTDEISGPSIRQAMEGKSAEDVKIIPGGEIPAGNMPEGILTEELVNEKWTEMLELLNDKPNLKSTLSRKPVFNEDGTLLVEIDNLLQQELIRTHKPKLVSWLRRELNNRSVDLVTRIRIQPARKIAYTEGEKLEEMMHKNEDLKLLKQRFQLDFDDL